MANGSSYTFRVNISDHNNETGTYRTHIYAYDKAGNYVSISAPDVQIPKKVTIRSLKKKKRGKFVVKYGRVSEADGYEISYNQGSRLFLSEKTTETSSLSKTVKNLKKGKKYYVRVRAYKWDSNGEKLYGPYSRVKRVKV